MTLHQYKYRAFISYSHADEKWAKWLHRSLETYRIPPRLVGQKTAMGPVPARLAPVFRDREELASATDLGSKLTEALEGAACLVVICSPSSARSHWVNEEILAYKRLGRSDRVFSLIVDGEPYASTRPGEEERECFPPALRYQIGADGELSRTPAEPIAADAREGKDGKAHAKIKLIAGILGVGFDDLRQRELQRRNRRLAIISTSALFGMVFAIGLATTAVIARNEAERQRARAETEAETARRTASFMIDLFAVSDPSEARGNTITAREILTKGAERISTELGDQPLIQTSLMNTIGKVYTSLGLYGDARDMLEEAVTLRRNMPEVPRAEFAQSALNLANVLTEKADYERAEPLYREALDALAAAEPPEPALALEVKAGLAELYFRLGRFKDAEPLLQQVLAERRSLFGERDARVADAIEELGLNLFDQGRFPEAEERLRESLALRWEILGKAPHPDIAENLNNLALVLSRLGDLAQAGQLYEQAVEMSRRLYGDQHPTVATMMSNLAEIYVRQRDFPRAEAMYIDVLAMQHALLGEEHPEVARVMKSLSVAYHDDDKLEEAIATCRSALDMQRRLLGERHPEVGSSKAVLGRWLTEVGELAEAEAMLRSGLDIQLETLDPEHPRIAVNRIDLAELLIISGRLDEALEQAQLGEESLETSLGRDHWRSALARQVLGAAMHAKGSYADAEKLLVESYQRLNDDDSVAPQDLTKALHRLISLYQDWGKQATADKYRAILKRASQRA